MIQELDPSPATTTSWLISHLNGSSSWSSKRKKRRKGKEGSLIIKDNSLGGIHRKYCLGLGLVKQQMRWTRDGHQNEVALGRDTSLLRCTSPPPKVDTKDRSPALMPSSDRVPAVMGGRPVGAGTCCRQGKAGDRSPARSHHWWPCCPREPWFRGFSWAIPVSLGCVSCELAYPPPSCGLGTVVAGDISEAGGMLTTTETCRDA